MAPNPQSKKSYLVHLLKTQDRLAFKNNGRLSVSRRLFMIFPSRSKLPKTIKFDYKPRYFDPKKEKIRKRRLELENVENGDSELIKNRISRRLQTKRRSQVIRSRQTARSNMILIAVMVALVVLTLTVMNKYIEPMVQAFFNL